MSSMRLLPYILFTLLSSIHLSANNYNNDNPEVDLFIFILIITIIFVAYKTFIFYLSKEKEKKYIVQKEQELADNALKQSDTLLDEGKDLINFLKMNAQNKSSSNETYRVQNLLNEVYGLIEPSLQKTTLSLSMT